VTKRTIRKLFAKTTKPNLPKEHPFDESDLLASLAREDPAALQALIEIYFPILCRFAEKHLRDCSLAKDVVQETFIKFWFAHQVFESINGLKAYLFTSTRNGCLNLVRSREREANRHLAVFGGTPAATDSILTSIVHSENIARVYQVVRNMPPATQKIFYLSYEEGLSVKQISEYLKMKLNTVKSHKYIALRHLRIKLANNMGSLLAFLPFFLK
jgi:RNA polymerase sigma factor (sigma-70 family)